MLNLTKLGPWEAGNIVKYIVRLFYRQGNIYIVSYLMHLETKMGGREKCVFLKKIFVPLLKRKYL